jgi:hypothetical protein
MQLTYGAVSWVEGAWERVGRRKGDVVRELAAATREGGDGAGADGAAGRRDTNTTRPDSLLSLVAGHGAVVRALTGTSWWSYAITEV